MSGYVVVTWESTRGAQVARPGRVQLGGDVIVAPTPACMARLLRDAPAPALLVRGAWPAAGVERVVVPLDLSAGPWRVGPAALGLAQAHGAEVVLVAVDDPLGPSARGSIDVAERLFAAAGARTRLVLAGRAPLARLASVLEAEAPDVVALATQPRSPSSIAGATGERVIEHLLREGTTSLLVVGDRGEHVVGPTRPASSASPERPRPARRPQPVAR